MPLQPATEPSVQDARALETCDLHVTAVAAEASLPRIVGVLRRTLWSIEELHHWARGGQHEIEVRASKRGGRSELLVEQLRREVIVIDVASRGVGAPAPAR